MQFELPEPRTSKSINVRPEALPATTLLTRGDLKRVERETITAALKQAGGKVSGAGGAAELLNMKPTTLSSRIKALTIR